MTRCHQTCAEGLPIQSDNIELLVGHVELEANTTLGLIHLVKTPEGLRCLGLLYICLNASGPVSSLLIAHVLSQTQTLYWGY